MNEELKRQLDVINRKRISKEFLANAKEIDDLVGNY